MDCVVVKSNKPMSSALMSRIAKETKSLVILLPLECTITSGEMAKSELENYRNLINKALEG